MNIGWVQGAAGVLYILLLALVVAFYFLGRILAQRYHQHHNHRHNGCCCTAEGCSCTHCVHVDHTQAECCGVSEAAVPLHRPNTPATKTAPAPVPAAMIR